MQTRSGKTDYVRGGGVQRRSSTRSSTASQPNVATRGRGSRGRRGAPGRGKRGRQTVRQVAPADHQDMPSRNDSIYDSIQLRPPNDHHPAVLSTDGPIPVPPALPERAKVVSDAAGVKDDSANHVSSPIAQAKTTDGHDKPVQSGSAVVEGADIGRNPNNLSSQQQQGRPGDEGHSVDSEEDQSDDASEDEKLADMESSQGTASGGTDTDVEPATTATTPAPPETVNIRAATQTQYSRRQAGRMSWKQKPPPVVVSEEPTPKKRSTRSNRHVSVNLDSELSGITTAQRTTRKRKGLPIVPVEQLPPKKPAIARDRAGEGSREAAGTGPQDRSTEALETGEEVKNSERKDGSPAAEDTPGLDLASLAGQRCPMCDETAEKILSDGQNSGFEKHIIMCAGAKPFGILPRCAWCLATGSKDSSFPTNSQVEMVAAAIAHYGEQHGLEFNAEKPFAAVYFEALITGSLGHATPDPFDFIDFNRGWARNLGHISINSPLVPEKYRTIYRKLANTSLAMDVSLKPHALDPELASLYTDYETMFTSYFKAQPIHYELHGTSASHSISSIYSHMYNNLPKGKLRSFPPNEDGSDPVLLVGYGKGTFGGGFGQSAANSYLRETEGSRQQVVPNGVKMVFDYEDRKTLEAQVQRGIEQHNCCGIVVEMMNNQGEMISLQGWKNLVGVCKLFKILLIVDECILAIRCGHPFSYQMKAYDKIAKPDFVIFGKGLLISGLALVSRSRVFTKVNSKILDIIVGKWRSKVSCMLCPLLCLQATVLLQTAIEQDWPTRAERVGNYVANLLDRFKDQLSFSYTRLGACFFLDKRLHTLPFVTAPAGEITRLFPSVNLNNFELGKVFDLEARKFMVKTLDGRAPLCCFSCGDAGQEAKGKYIGRCDTCGWYSCRGCMEKWKGKSSKGEAKESHFCVPK